MTNLPARLIVRAPAGGFISEAGPTASILPSRAISEAFSTEGLPATSMMRAPMNALTPSEVADCLAECPLVEKAARPAQDNAKQKPIDKILILIFAPFKAERM